jgi:hypothetical protein
VLSLGIVEHIEESLLTSNFPLAPLELNIRMPHALLVLLNGLVVVTYMSSIVDGREVSSEFLETSLQSAP